MPETLSPWYAIATPHEDIQKGRLSEAVFAANLWEVTQNTAPDIYCDAEAFFAKTYLTHGLTSILSKVSRAISGGAEAGDRIISLQTSFGGGKTHVLVALWHLARNSEILRSSSQCADLRRALKDEIPQRVRSIAVFTNQTCDATQGRQTPEGIRTRTLWGELAYQLGGVELYRDIEANDQARTCPQGLFESILRKSSPCLILLDELADYCVGAAGVQVGAGTLADQTISFAQQLCQAVSNVPGAALVATLPASHLEVASSERGQEILAALENRFGRMAADARPVADEEIYQVVRRRLFETIGDPTEIEKVAGAYARMYQQHPNEVPQEATRADYKQSIINSYPFHPTLIDAFYKRWGSHNGFQRTRGVLRLLASIVGDLWQRRSTETQSQALIQPAHLNFTVDALKSSLTRLWGASYESVIAADVIGKTSNSVQFDEERGGDYLREKIGQGLASTILLGSFGAQGDRVGYSTRELKLCTARPGLNWSYTDGALLELENRAFYMRFPTAGNLGKRYWFDTRPTLVNLIVRYRQQFVSNDFNTEIIDAVQTQVNNSRLEPATWRVLVNPGSDLPEQRSLALLILAPDLPYAENGQAAANNPPLERRVKLLSTKCGARDRLYRNTLLFLLPSVRGLTKLRNALREVTTLEAIKRDYGTQLDPEQKGDLETRLTTARQSVTQSLGAAFSYIARIRGEEISVTALSSAGSNFGDHLQIVWKQLVEEEEWILRKIGRVTMQESGLVLSDGSMRLKDAIESFLRYTDKPMIATRDAVVNGLQDACKERLIGLGQGLNAKELQKKWCGGSITIDPNEEGLWIIPAFEPEPALPPVVTPPPSGGTPAGSIFPPSDGSDTGPISTPPYEGGDIVIPPAGNTIRQVTIQGNVPVESWADIFRSFVGPAARMGLKKMKLGIHFEFVTQDGQPLDENDPRLKAMIESARQLGLDLKKE